MSVERPTVRERVLNELYWTSLFGQLILGLVSRCVVPLHPLVFCALVAAGTLGMPYARTIKGRLDPVNAAGMCGVAVVGGSLSADLGDVFVPFDVAAAAITLATLVYSTVLKRRGKSGSLRLAWACVTAIDALFIASLLVGLL